MKAQNFVSKRGHYILLATAFLAFCMSVSSFAFTCIQTYNQDVIEIYEKLERSANWTKTDNPHFEVYVLVSAPIAPFLVLAEIFITFIIFLFLIKPKKYLFSSFFTILSCLIFVFWFVHTRYLISGITDFPKPQGFERLLAHSNFFDFILLFLISILFFWQISILLRGLIKTLQRKSKLP